MNNGRMDQWMSGRVEERKNETIEEFCEPNFTTRQISFRCSIDYKFCCESQNILVKY